MSQKDAKRQTSNIFEGTEIIEPPTHEQMFHTKNKPKLT